MSRDGLIPDTGPARNVSSSGGVAASLAPRSGRVSFLSTLRENRAPLAILTVGCVISFLLFVDWRERQERNVERELAQIAQERIELLKEDLVGSTTVLHSIRSLFAANRAIDRAQFDDFVRDAFARQPGLHALSWNPRVVASERARVEEQTRAEGYPAFHFTQLDASEQTVPAAERPEYFPVLYLAPMKGNEPALGLDVNADPKRREALERARATDQPAATAPIRLAQEAGEQLGFCVALPVFQNPNGAAETHDSALRGYAVAVFRIGDLIGTSLRKIEAQHVSVSIYDSIADHVLVYSSPLQTKAPRLLEHRARLDVAGRKWTLVFVPTEEFVSRFPAWQPWAVLGIGIAITALLAGYFVRNASRTADVRRRVAERTEELSSEVAERKRAETELQNAQRDLALRVRERTDELRRSNDALLAEILVRKRAEDAAETANKAKSAFLANMSHEIRTPLNSILGYAQILDRDSELHGFARDAVATMANSSRHLLNLVNDVLDLAKIEAGRMELQAHDFDLHGMLAGVIAMFSQRCEEAGVALRLEGCAAVPTAVHGDEGKLRKVLINLVGNAVKYITVGEVVVRVSRAADSHWRFEVEDTGPGIAQAAQARIFEAFHRGPGSEQTGGTGLGLAISRREVELLGGKLSVRSEPGAGSCFAFSVPLGASDRAGEAVGNLGSREVRRLAAGQTVRVLLADDVAENRDLLSRILTSIGCEVAAAANGGAALELIEPENPPDIVFLDVNMPVLGGARVARRIFEMFGYDRLKVVLMSASALTNDRETYRHAGCHDFVLLPYSCDRIFEVLAKLLAVEFEYRAESASGSYGTTALDFTKLSLPEDLALRLLMAAELHSTTVMKACLHEMEQIDDGGRRLAEHLRGFMFSYDMDSVLKIVSQISIEGHRTEP